MSEEKREAIAIAIYDRLAGFFIGLWLLVYNFLAAIGQAILWIGFLMAVISILVTFGLIAWNINQGNITMIMFGGM